MKRILAVARAFGSNTAVFLASFAVSFLLSVYLCAYVSEIKYRTYLLSVEHTEMGLDVLKRIFETEESNCVSPSQKLEGAVGVAFIRLWQLAQTIKKTQANVMFRAWASNSKRNELEVARAFSYMYLGRLNDMRRDMQIAARQKTCLPAHEFMNLLGTEAVPPQQRGAINTRHRERP